MSKDKQRLWIFFIILSYVVIAIVGFFIAYLIKSALFHPQQSAHSPTKVMSKATPIPHPPGWKTYTNTDYKLQFSYPLDDTIKSSSYGFGVTSLTLQKTNGNLDFQILLMPKTLAATVGQDFASYYTMPNHTTKVIKSPLSSDNTSEKFTKIHNRTINGLEAIDYQSIASNAKPDVQPEIGTFMQLGDNLALISTGQSNKVKLNQLTNSLSYSN